MSAVRQTQFIQKHQALWEKFEAWLDYQELSRWQKNSKKNPVEKPDEIDLPHAYRRICHHFALANSRMYNPVLVEKLNKLVVRGHHKLYSTRTSFLSNMLEYFAGGFPALVRKEWRIVSVAAVLFYIPFIAAILAIQFNPDLVYSVMEGDMVDQLESMYEPDRNERLGRERESDTDLYMFGFYIKHNIGIDFKMFAGGLLFGIGSLFFLLFNGVFLGAAFGHMTQIGYIDSFWGFVVGHGAFELNAMVLAGAAGLKLAEALIKPGRKSRSRALVDNGKIAVNIMYGVVAMSLIAAFLEAFWSSTVMPVTIKYVVAVVLWSLVAIYFIYMGRTDKQA
jgi:uncharacterized membrane protein SpoIIM required for sporulation